MKAIQGRACLLSCPFDQGSPAQQAPSLCRHWSKFSHIICSRCRFSTPAVSSHLCDSVRFKVACERCTRLWQRERPHALLPAQAVPARYVQLYVHRHAVGARGRRVEWRAVACPESGCSALVSARASCPATSAASSHTARPAAGSRAARRRWWRYTRPPSAKGGGVPGAGVAARDLEAHRARHALQQVTEQLARRPDRHPCRCQ